MDEVLPKINEASRTQYEVNSDGNLQATDEINEGGSSIYSDSIDKGIAAEATGTITQDPDAIVKGRPIDNPTIGGGATTGFAGENQQVVVSGNGFTENGVDSNGDFIIVEVSPAMVLMHEIVQHMVPNLTSTDLGTGLGPDNAVRAQLGLPLRPEQPDHPTMTRRFGR